MDSNIISTKMPYVYAIDPPKIRTEIVAAVMVARRSSGTTIPAMT